MRERPHGPRRNFASPPTSPTRILLPTRRAQQAYVSAWLNLGQFRGAASFSTWLIRIAVHEAFARIRRTGRFVEGDGEDLMTRLPSRERNPEQQVADREIGRLVRTVFVLREIE